MRLRAGVVGVVLLTLAGCDRHPWQEYRSAEGHYRVEMPGRPQIENHTIKPGKLTYTMTTAVVSLHGGAYLTAWADLPVGIDPEMRKQVQFIADRYGATVTGTESSELAGSPGLAFTLTTTKPPGEAAGRLWQFKNRLYLALVLGDRVRADDSDVVRFFESFKLIDPLMQ
jgi:hypothetical protein